MFSCCHETSVYETNPNRTVKCVPMPSPNKHSSFMGQSHEEKSSSYYFTLNIHKSLRLTVVWNLPSPLRQWRVWQECVWSLSSLGSSAEWLEWSAACVWRPSSPRDWSPAVGCSLPQPLSSLHTRHTTTIRTRARSIVGKVDLCGNLTDPLGWTGLRRSQGSACCRSSPSAWDWRWILRPPGRHAPHLKRATAGASLHTHTDTHSIHKHKSTSGGLTDGAVPRNIRQSQSRRCWETINKHQTRKHTLQTCNSAEILIPPLMARTSGSLTPSAASMLHSTFSTNTRYESRVTSSHTLNTGVNGFRNTYTMHYSGV